MGKKFFGYHLSSLMIFALLEFSISFEVVMANYTYLENSLSFLNPILALNYSDFIIYFLSTVRLPFYSKRLFVALCEGERGVLLGIYLFYNFFYSQNCFLFHLMYLPLFPSFYLPKGLFRSLSIFLRWTCMNNNSCLQYLFSICSY